MSCSAMFKMIGFICRFLCFSLKMLFYDPLFYVPGTITKVHPNFK